jgi:hypothetical protein
MSKEQDMSHTHDQAVQRRRRIIFNNDGDDALYSAREPTPQGLLDVRATPLLGTQVDTISYCTTLPFGSFQHNTRVGEVFTTSLDTGRNITGDLIRQGTDPLAVMTGWCREHGIEVFSSFRMNDVHDSAGYPVFLPQWKREHPQWLFGSQQNPPRYGFWSGVDYGQAEVRKMALAYMTDICSRYDLDGIELDFYRAPPLFTRHAWGKPVLKRELEQMTQLMRLVRQMTQAVETQRGRPFLVAVRVLESVELSRDHGLDLLAWLREHLVDLVITGEVSIAPWEDLIGLGHQFGVPVYPCIRRGMWYDDPDYTSIRSIRAQALNAWQLGADGIYLFNLFPEEGWTEAYSQLGDPQGLQTGDKVYSTDPTGAQMLTRYVANLEQYLTRTIVSPRHPLKVGPGAARRVPLHVGDSMEGRSRAPRITARLDVKDPRRASQLHVALNGHPLTAAEQEEGRTSYQVAPRCLRCGYNVFELASSGSQAITVLDLRLSIEY